MEHYKQFRHDKIMGTWYVAHYEKKDGVMYFLGLEHPTPKDWADRERSMNEVEPDMPELTEKETN